MRTRTDKVIFCMVFLSLSCLLAISARSVLGNSPWDPREERKDDKPCDPCTPEGLEED